MRTRPIRLAVAVLQALWIVSALPAAALTLVLPSDQVLADEATLIVEGAVSAVELIEASAATDYTVQIGRVLKGIPSGSEIKVRLPGGPAGNGLWLWVPGTPSWDQDQRLLLFLTPRAHTWSPLHLVAGAFRIEPRGFGSVAVRDLEDVQLLSLPDAASPEAPFEPERDLALFGRWVADRAAGVHRPVDYLREGSGAEQEPVRLKTSRFAILPQTVGWTEFARGKEVTWFTHVVGQDGLPSGGVSEFLTAMAVWNDDPATDIRYSYGGTTDFSGHPDRNYPQSPINAVFFNDPYDTMPGSFSCKTGGPLAYAMLWSAGPTGGPLTAREAHIVTNDGIACWLKGSKNAEEVFGHELGHTLGLGHSCGIERNWPCPRGQQPLMRAYAYGDKRGALLTPDDRAGIFVLYGGDLDAPGDLQATAIGRTSVTLAWSDNSVVEETFLVQLKRGRNWKTVATVPKDAIAATVTKLKPNSTATFRVVASSGAIAAASPELTIRTAR